MAKINPNSDFDFIEKADISNARDYSKFLHSIKFDNFKHIIELTINFLKPVSIISGTNKIGKTTILTALACSHFNFLKRNSTNGKFERHTWNALIKMTDSDSQENDWTYYITYREGDKTQTKRGQKKKATGKWNGLGKKESQIKKRQVVLIDLDRAIPLRSTSKTSYSKARNAVGEDYKKKERLQEYLSYIFEEAYSEIKKLATHIDKDVVAYNTGKKYSSFNSASGEDVITRTLLDILDADKDALILIDEIEVGLHPKIQRKLLEVIYHVSREEKKQFIITTHSPSIFTHVGNESRIFIDKKNDGTLKAIQPARTNEALSKMDSNLYPLLDIFCEDIVAKKIIQESFKWIKNNTDFEMIDKLCNIIVTGTASETHKIFLSHQRTYEHKKIKTGYVCILDGDQVSNFNCEDGLFFLHTDGLAPEKFLVGLYLAENNNSTLQYHYESSDPHILFNKMTEYNIANDNANAFEICWEIYKTKDKYVTFMSELTYFLINQINKFSK